MTYTSLTLTKDFWDKNLTKIWLQNNTTFKYPKTVEKDFGFDNIIKRIETMPNGDWVLKPNTGRKSVGVVLFEKKDELFRIFSIKDSLCFSSFVEEISKKIKYRTQTTEVRRKNGLWLIEEWVKPHKRFHSFTEIKKCPPILRFCGRPEISIIGLSPVYPNITGLSSSGWSNRKYIWIDTDGVVHPVKDMNLEHTDKYTIEVVHSKSLDDPPVGMTIKGIPEIVEQINKEIVPKIKLYQNHTWCCDGIFNENDIFTVVELNHGPGIQFRGFKWKEEQNDT